MVKVLCAIIEHEERVLVTQRSEMMREPLLWEFPGGKLEQGETEKECLVREILEELHINVLPIQRLTPVVHNIPSKSLELIPYICQYEGGTIQLLEHRAFEWATYQDLRKYTWCLPDLPVVEEYLLLKHKK